VTKEWFLGRGLIMVTSITEDAFTRAYVGVEPVLQIIISIDVAKSESKDPRTSSVADPQLAEWALKSPATMMLTWLFSCRRMDDSSPARKESNSAMVQFGLQ